MLTLEISSFYFTRLQIGEVASQKHTIKKCTYRAKIETQSWSSHMKATPYLGKLHPFCIIWSGSRDVTFYTPGKLMYVAEYKRAMHSVPSSNLTCLSDCLFKTCQLFPRQWKKKKKTNSNIPCRSQKMKLSFDALFSLWPGRENG